MNLKLSILTGIALLLAACSPVSDRKNAGAEVPFSLPHRHWMTDWYAYTPEPCSTKKRWTPTTITFSGCRNTSSRNRMKSRILSTISFSSTFSSTSSMSSASNSSTLMKSSKYSSLKARMTRRALLGSGNVVRKLFGSAPRCVKTGQP